MNYLFVCGPPRSGTTVLAQLLNAHPEIAIGIERYKYAYKELSLRNEITPELFSAARFFDFRREDTNITRGYYENFRGLRQKYDNVRYRGDKLPGILKLRKHLDSGLAHTRYVFIYRDIESVCASWNARANNTEDHWPAENDYRAAVLRMNADLRAIHELAVNEPDRFLLVRYESLFGGGGKAVVDALLARLGLMPDPKVDRHLAKDQETHRERAAGPLRLDDQQRNFIRAKMDWELLRKIEQLSISPAQATVP